MITQNNASRIATGWTNDTNIQHLHIETDILPLKEHLKLHASQLKQKSKLPSRPIHSLLKQPKPYRHKNIP
jgi:hypothetical protein